MKKFNLSLLTVLLCTFSVFAQLVTESCSDPNTTAGDMPAPTWDDGSQVENIDKESAVISVNVDLSQETVGWQGTNDYAVVVTSLGLDEGDMVQCIRGVTYDGVFDFSFGGEEIICADYNFFGFAYNQSEMVALGENQFVCVLYECLCGVTDIDQVLNCFLADSDLVNDTSCITFQEVIELADSIVGILPLTLCLAVEADGSTISVGIEELSSINSALIYPNPVRDRLIIELSSLANSNATMSIVNIYGQEVRRKEMQIQQGESTYQFDLEGLRSGSYFLNMKIGQETKTQKIQITDY